ncbi:metalloregulator ArsR/SmtB family transcription factor [Candidatus Fermentibacteria bacterium]|nr:metalloregulator ArsR/SmtB family transcription factor [Candidatus Fermentibacteria bacterium]
MISIYLYVVMNLITTIAALSALADATRLRLLAVLGEGSLAVSELVTCLELSQPRVSHHLAILLRCGLVRVRREGVRAYYARESRGEPVRLADAAIARLDDPTVRADRLRAARLLADRKAERRGFFATLARTWPENLAAWIDLDAYRTTVAALVPPGGTMADLGCGSGWLLPTLSAIASRVIGVDHSPEILDQARQRARDAGIPGCEFRLGELEHLPLREREVDAVFIGLVLHSVPDPQAALEEAARVCETGGTLTVIEPLAHHNEHARDELGGLWMGFSESEMAQWVASSGFTMLSAETRTPPAGLGLIAVQARRD